MSAVLKLCRGDRVEVHARSTGPHQWIGGTVDKVAGKGAFVRTDAGHENFYRWKEIRLMQKPPSSEASRRIVTLPARSTIVDVVERRSAPTTLRSATSLSSAVVPAAEGFRSQVSGLETENVQKGPGMLDAQSPKPKALLSVPAPAQRPSPPSARQTILMDLHPGVTSKHGVPPRKLHDPTPIGNAFRAYRLRRGYAQNEMADHLGVTGSTLSQVELGDMIPNDDLILAFAEEASTPLDELIHLRENSRVPIAASTEGVRSKDSGVGSGSGNSLLPTPHSSESAPLPPSPKRTLLPFSEVVIAVEAIVPMPGDASKRARWVQVVTELYELRADER